MRKLLLLFTLFFASFQNTLVWAQAAPELKQTIKGTVSDVANGLPLPGATVAIVGSNPLIGTVTDANGRFKLANVAIGRVSLRISMIGYAAKTLPEILVSSGKMTDLSIALQEELVTAGEVVITAEQKNKNIAIDDFTTVSARTFSPEETQRFAGALNDPSRMVSVFPGVVSNPDGANDIIIRGNSPRGLLWRMEGLEMPNPNHFSTEGASGGAISMLNPNILRSSDFLTGAFPAQYGNAASGVFDLGIRKGNADKREYVAQIGVLGIEAQAEGPFKKGGEASYVANYRYSSLDLLSKTGLELGGTDAIPRFQDGAFKINLPTKNGVWSIFGLGGYNAVSQTIKDDQEKDRAKSKGSSAMYFTGIKNISQLSDKQSIEFSVGYSGISNRNTESANPYNADSALFKTFDSKNGQSFLRYSTTLLGKVNAANNYRAGVIITQLGFNINQSSYDYDTRRYSTNYKKSGVTQMYQAFAGWQNRPSEKVTINGGVHYTHFALNNQHIVEPRLGVSWQVNPRHTLTFANGMHNRADAVSVYFSEITGANGNVSTPNKNLKIQRNIHSVIGHQVAIAEGLNLKTEAYFQYIYDAATGTDTNNYYSLMNEVDLYNVKALENKGKGRNYGIDINLDRNFGNGFYMMISQSLFRSEYKNPGFSWRASRYDSRFVSNLVAGKEWKLKNKGTKQRTLVANIKALYMGGVVYTPLDRAASAASDNSVYDYKAYNSKRAPNIVRIDFSIGIRKNRERSTHTLKLDIINVLNELAVVGEFYDVYNNKVAKPTGIPFLPNLLYRIEF
jgi:hypothetical protein